MRFFINAGNLTAAGPREVLDNLLPALVQAGDTHTFFALIPAGCRGASWLKHPRLQAWFANTRLPRLLHRSYEVFNQVPRLCRKTGAEVCLTLGDLGPVNLEIPHVVMLHNAYIAYTSKDIPRVFSRWQRTQNACFRRYLRRLARHCSQIIVQTPVMKAAIERNYGIDANRIEVIPSTITEVARLLMRGQAGTDEEVSRAPQRLKLVFLSAMYPHKNHHVLPGVLEELGRRSLSNDVHIFLTLDERKSADLLQRLSQCAGTVTNLGPLDRRRAAAVLVAADGLLLPTLVEAFGLVYLEALAAGLPILTSDRPFAKWICGDLAHYFEPEDPVSIANAIEQLLVHGKPENFDERAAARLKDVSRRLDRGGWPIPGRARGGVSSSAALSVVMTEATGGSLRDSAAHGIGMSPSVLVVVVTRNSRTNLDECLGSMSAQTYEPFRILVVDSGSTDGTVEHIRSGYPAVGVLETGRNVGYRTGNRIGMADGKDDYVVVCNDDVEVDPQWLSSMVSAMERNPEFGLVTPRILFFHDRGRINVAGNTLHYSGVYGARGANDAAMTHDSPCELAAVSGCCFMIRRAVLDEIGGFSEDLDEHDTGWHASFEDLDLSWRAQIAGYRIGYIPDSMVYHKYVRKETTPAMFESWEWGRYMVVVRNYSTVGLILVAPILVALEVMSLAVAIARGREWRRRKGRVIRWLWVNRSRVREMRRKVQSTRRVEDDEIVSRMSPRIRLSHLVRMGALASVAQRALDIGFTVYYWFLLTALRCWRFCSIRRRRSCGTSLTVRTRNH